MTLRLSLYFTQVGAGVAFLYLLAHIFVLFLINIIYMKYVSFMEKGVKEIKKK